MPRKKQKARKRSRPSTSGMAARQALEKKVRAVAHTTEELMKRDPSVALGYLMQHEEELGHLTGFLNTQGMVLLRLGQADQAERALRKALSLGRSAFTLTNLGFAYHQRGDYHGAIKYHRQALDEDPKDYTAFANMAHSLEDLGLLDEAELALTTANQLSQGRDPRVLVALSSLMLAKGRIEEGGKLIDAGFGCGERTPPIDPKQHYWRGEDIADKTILVWRERGIGDEVRNASMYPDLIRAAGHCIIECEERLQSIFQRTFPDARVIAQNKADQTATERPAFDYHVGQDSLLHEFRPTLDRFPKTAGHLIPDPDKLAFWRDRFAALNAQAVIGISWRTGLMQQERALWTFTLDDIADVLTTPGVAFVNLFYGDGEAELQAAEENYGITIHRWPDVDLKNDLEDVLAMSAALDLVITSASSTYDFAGAVGTECWTFIPGRHRVLLGTDHIPYYPSVRVYERKLSRSWDLVMKRVKRNLDAWLAERGGVGRQATG